MKKTILSLGIGVFFGAQAMAETICFIAKESTKVLKQEGDCKKRHTPQSTFKIPLSLMGYDAGILVDETQPEWTCEDGCDIFINVCKGAHTPKTWMRDSCLWYSRVLTPKLGMEKFKDYILKFNYGNKDVSGDKGKDNGLTHSWVSSTLEISPDEQTEFLQKLVDHELPVIQLSYENTKKIVHAN